MITDTRKMFKTRWFRIAILVMAVTMAGGGMLLIQLVDYVRGDKEWALRVNSQVISRNQLARAVAFQQEWLNQIRQMYGQYADAMLEQQGLSKDPVKLAVEHVIFETLLSQQADALGVVVDPEYIIDKLGDKNYVMGNLSGTIPMEIFNPQGGISEFALRNYLRRMRMSPAEFESMVEEVFKRTLVRHMAIPASCVPNFILRDAYQRQYAPRTFALIKLDYTTVLDRVKQKGIAPDEVEAFFETHKGDYQVPEKRTGMSWQFDAGSYDVTISDDAMRAYYDTHQDEFVKERPKIQVRRILFKTDDDAATKSQVRAQAEALRAELLENPEDFGRIAQERSQDEISVADGGLLPYFSRGERIASDGIAFERAAFTLQRDGDISAIVETNNGIELLQRVDRLPKTFKSFEEVASQIRTILAQKEMEKRFVSDVRAMLTNKQVDTTAWKSFIKRHTPKASVITDRENDQSKQAHELFALKEGEYGVYLHGQVGEVVMLEGIQEAYTPELQDIRARVEADFYVQRAKNELKAVYEKADTLLASESLEAVAKELGRPIEVTKEVTPGDDTEKELEKQNIPVQYLLELTFPGAKTAHLSDKALVVAELKSIQEIDEQQFSDKRDELLRTVGSQFIRLFISGYIASLHKNAKIETNDSIVNIT